MKRALVAVVIVVVAGSVAYAMYHRTEAEPPAAVVSEEITSPCGGTARSMPCKSAVCVEGGGTCPAAKGGTANAALCCKDHPDCACAGACKGNPECKCPADCKADCTGDCGRVCQAKGTCPGAGAKETESPCKRQCPGKCGGQKARGTL